MQPTPLMVYRRAWCADSDAAVAYLHRQQIDYQEIDIEHDATAAQGVAFVTGGDPITPTLVYRRQAIVCDPWNPARFAAWWQFANTTFPDPR